MIATLPLDEMVALYVSDPPFFARDIYPSLSQDQKIALCMRDSVLFSKNILQHVTWDKQDEMLRAIFENDKTGVKACHASSKTYSAAEAAVYWLARYKDGVVISTAPGDRQVTGLLWREVREALSRCLLDFGVKPTLKGLNITETNYGMGMATRSDVTAGRGVRFSGFHGGKILLIVDEAPGVSQDIWDGIQGIQAGGEVHVVALGNPVIPSGPFYDIFHTKRAGWHCITIDAFETPNLIGLNIHDIAKMSQEELDLNPSHVPNLITRRWVRNMMDELNVDPDAPDELQDPLWQSKVRGQFPTQAEDSVIWLAWIEAARTKERDDQPKGFFTAGVDPAAGGDNATAVEVVEGYHLAGRNSWRKKDPRGEVVAFLNGFGPMLREVRVDVDGVGYYFAKHLGDQGFNVVEFHNGATAINEKRFKNKKTEGFWNLRELYQRGLITGKIDDTTMSQLSSIRYGHDPKGIIEVESKDSMAKRGVKSPDHADAQMMALAPVHKVGTPPSDRMMATLRHIPAMSQF
ncbi:MAG: hypothetical protein GY896_22900 [Gammaproteobacteria bacterium]|nr:hypothetical protein [Gammaproteobacteria bacterium]